MVDVEKNAVLPQFISSTVSDKFDYFDTAFHRRSSTFVGSRTTLYHPAAEDFAAIHLICRPKIDKSS